MSDETVAIILLVLVAAALVSATLTWLVARRKGLDSGYWFVASIFVPFVPLIVVLRSPDQTAGSR